MLVTIPTTAVNMRELLTEAQFSAAHAAVADQDGYFRTSIQNLSANAVYVELGDVATVAGGTKIPAAGGFVTLSTEALEKISVIAETSPATNVRIMIG